MGKEEMIQELISEELCRDILMEIETAQASKTRTEEAKQYKRGYVRGLQKAQRIIKRAMEVEE
jgi:hypothetical protein